MSTHVEGRLSRARRRVQRRPITPPNLPTVRTFASNMPSGMLGWLNYSASPIQRLIGGTSMNMIAVITKALQATSVKSVGSSSRS